MSGAGERQEVKDDLEQQQPVDRKEVLRAGFDKVEAESAAQQDKQPKSDSAERDERGRYKAKDKSDEKADEKDKAEKPEAKPWDARPTQWKKDKDALWQSMSPEARQYVFEREQQNVTGAQPLVTKAQLADQITKAAEPYMHTVQQLGLDLPRAVAGLMRVDNDLRTLPMPQRIQTLLGVAASYGIDLNAIAANPQNIQNFQAPSPQLMNMQQELAQLRGQFSSYQENQSAMADAQTLTEIQKFSQKAEHFEEVRPVMVQLLYGGMADGLQDAYEKAIRLNPDLSAKIQAAEKAEAETAQRKAADEAAKRAKAAAVSVKSGTPGKQPPADARDRRSVLKEALDSLSERY